MTLGLRARAIDRRRVMAQVRRARASFQRGDVNATAPAAGGRPVPSPSEDAARLYSAETRQRASGAVRQVRGGRQAAAATGSVLNSWPA